MMRAAGVWLPKLAMELALSCSEWPCIEIVDVASILRLEQVHPD